jgi:hypothetical protein
VTNAEIERALKTLAPGSPYTLVGDDYAGLDWLDGGVTKPTEGEITGQIAVDLAADIAGAYIGQRVAAELAAGMTESSMVQALWAKVMETNSTPADTLHAIRVKARVDYPEEAP